MTLAPLLSRLFVKSSLPILLFIFCSSSLFSQDRCGTVTYTNKLKLNNKLREDNQTFEKWLKQKITSRKQALDGSRTQTSTYQIPVVVHIVHNGEPIGTGLNLSNEQVISQIEVLNKDFQRLNSDAINTPDEFIEFAGSMDIEFVLAKQDPDGLASNGIVRVEGSKDSWTSNDDVELKGQSYWPAENYLNVWVCDLTDYLGYTQFPVSNLPGLEDSPENRLTDGIVIWYRSFGSSDDGDFNLHSRYAKGRTLTHEMGHFFGLRHIWGDDNDCSGTDYVDDTPNQSNQTTNCPAVPRTTCVVHAMYQNYLDYTDDLCMNMFTNDQVTRMISVLENSIRRSTLLTSSGKEEPDPVPNDLGISAIITPRVIECGTAITPSIEIKNYGTNNISEAQIKYKLNGELVETLNLTDLNIEPLQTLTVNFAQHQLALGASVFNFDIIKTNGTTDGNPFNNIMTSNSINFQPTTAPYTTIPFRENLDTTFPDHWSLINPTNGKNWKTVSTNFNTSVYFEAYTNTIIGDEAWLVSSPLDFSTTDKASLFFDISYALNNTRTTHEKLKIISSVGCGNPFDGQLYDKSGDALSEADASDAWEPESSTDWKREFVNLTSLAGKKDVRLAFVVTNGHGNNLYIDNIEFFTSDDPEQPQVDNPYFVYYKPESPSDFFIKFNMPEEQTVGLEIMDTMGRSVFSTTFVNVLNQTFPVALDHVSGGIYIVKFRSRTETQSARIYIAN
jgi:hypothetical protein